jgi:hypothetical protein
VAACCIFASAGASRVRAPVLRSNPSNLEKAYSLWLKSGEVCGLLGIGDGTERLDGHATVSNKFRRGSFSAIPPVIFTTVSASAAPQPSCTPSRKRACCRVVLPQK